ncbi:hypothetical protein Tco_1194006 [Tanacetum coccineum]
MSSIPSNVYLAAGVFVMEEEYNLSLFHAFKVCPVELICQSMIAFLHIVFQFNAAFVDTNLPDLEVVDRVLPLTDSLDFEDYFEETLWTTSLSASELGTRANGITKASSGGANGVDGGICVSSGITDTLTA